MFVGRIILPYLRRGVIWPAGGFPYGRPRYQHLAKRRAFRTQARLPSHAEKGRALFSQQHQKKTQH
jgi:hypothetical protein